MKTNPNDPCDWSLFIKSMTDLDGKIYEGLFPGLTKREYFAALAMQSLILHPDFQEKNEGVIAKMSATQADCLIQALSERESS